MLRQLVIGALTIVVLAGGAAAQDVTSQQSCMTMVDNLTNAWQNKYFDNQASVQLGVKLKLLEDQCTANQLVEAQATVAELKKLMNIQ